MPKLLKDILDGVKKSKIVPGSTGSNPGVDYEPKAPNEQEFVKKHEREKHADRVGNEDDIYQATNVKSSIEKEPRHGRKDIKASEKVNETVDIAKKTLNEVLTKKTSAGEFIKDFQDSDNPKFAGKSKEKRKQMALAAYYAKQNEEVKEDLAVPLLGGKDNDESAEMAKTQLRALANKAMALAMHLSDDVMVEPWVQAKIAVAKDQVTAVHDYMIYGDKKEQTAQNDTPITFPVMNVDVATGVNIYFKSLNHQVM